MDNVKPIWRPSPRLGLFAVFAAAATLRLWRLDQNGFGNEYYTAGVRSMSLGWHNFLYNSFDPAGFISVDKPPFVMVGDAPFISRRLGADVAARPITEWVQETGQIVDPAFWRSSALGGRRSGMRLYDLRPGPLTGASP